jgi:hypothetical protein
MLPGRSNGITDHLPSSYQLPLYRLNDVTLGVEAELSRLMQLVFVRDLAHLDPYSLEEGWLSRSDYGLMVRSAAVNFQIKDQKGGSSGCK